jgi:thiamine pyrophosphokinase
MSGLTVKNAKWPLDHVEVPFGSTLTLSNVAGNDLEILLMDGSAVAICRFDKSAGTV